MGAMAAFSFYPGKNLGAYGEGGAVVTSEQSDLVQILSTAFGRDVRLEETPSKGERPGGAGRRGGR